MCKQITRCERVDYQRIPLNSPRGRRGVGCASVRITDKLLSRFITCKVCQSMQFLHARLGGYTDIFQFVLPFLQV